MNNKLKIALIQNNVSKDIKENLINIKNYIIKAKLQGAQLISLCECFNSPYGTQYFPKYAEKIPDGDTCKILSEIAKQQSIYLVGGSIPEIDNNKYYNTCTVWNPNGELLTKFRKMHLFDIDIPGKITFKESDVLTPGNELATFNIGNNKIGLGICYDMRFDEFAKLYKLKGCDMLIYPGAFNLVTGPLHWELLQRCRAVDNQLFVLTISPARGKDGYIAWGHSQITDPWGKIIAKAGPDEELIIADIDFDECKQVRKNIPIFNQRRTDIYETILKK